MIIVQMIVDIRETIMEIRTVVRRILMVIHMVARRIRMEMTAMVARETRMVIAMEVRHKGLNTILMIMTKIPISMVVRMVEVIIILATVIKMTAIKILNQKIKAQVISLILIWEVRHKTIIIIEIGNQSQGPDLDQEAVIRQIQEDMEANKIQLKIMTISKTRNIGAKREKQLLRQKLKHHVHMRSGAPTKLNKSSKKIFNKIDSKRQTNYHPRHLAQNSRKLTLLRIREAAMILTVAMMTMRKNKRTTKAIWMHKKKMTLGGKLERCVTTLLIVTQLEATLIMMAMPRKRNKLSPSKPTSSIWAKANLTKVESTILVVDSILILARQPLNNRN